MMPEIREFPSIEFYKDKLKDSEERTNRTFPESLDILSTNNHLVFDLKYGREAVVNHSYFNEEEMQ
jgi:AAA domain